MTMSDDETLLRARPRPGTSSRATFTKREARGPIIDQEGREIPPESLGEGFREFRFEFDDNPFGSLTREQRLARLEALAKLLDVAFVVPGTNIRYGIDGLIGLIPVVGDIITTTISLWLVREARALGAPWHLTARLEALAKLLDVAFVVPGTNIRYGIDGLIGLIPVVGDIITTTISLWLVREARALGAPWHLTARMLGNVAVDGVVGMVPFAGDAFDVMFRANMRNVRLLRRWIDRQGR
jgi:hypothetical protein